MTQHTDTNFKYVFFLNTQCKGWSERLWVLKEWMVWTKLCDQRKVSMFYCAIRDMLGCCWIQWMKKSEVGCCGAMCGE